MSGLYSLYKTWGDDETLANEDLNNSFETILENSIATEIEGYSTLNNVPSYDRAIATIDPAPGGDPLASDGNSSVAGEIQKLRYQIQKITGEDLWTTPPRRSLASGSASVAMIQSFESVYAVTQNQTYVGPIDDNPSPSFLDSAIKKFGNNSLWASSGPTSLGVSTARFDFPLTISVWFYSLNPDDYIYSDPIMGLDIYLNSSGKVCASFQSATAATASTKATFTITGTGTYSASTTWHNVIVRISSNTSDGALSLLVDGVEEGTQVTGQALLTYLSSTALAIVGSKKGAVTYSEFLAMSQLPETGGAWTKTGTGTTTISLGTLSLAKTGTNQLFYGKTIAPSAPINMTVTAKLRITVSNVDGANFAEQFRISISSDVANRSLSVVFGLSSIIILDNSVFVYEVPFNASDWHTYQIKVTTIATVTNMTLYADGRRLVTMGISGAYGGAVEGVTFGYVGTTGNSFGMSSQIEYLGYATNTAVSAYIPNTNAAGHLDDLAFISEFLDDDTVIEGLQNYPAASVFAFDNSLGKIYPDTTGSDGTTVSATSVTMVTTGVIQTIRNYGGPVTIMATGSVSTNNIAGTVYIGIDVNGDLTSRSGSASTLHDQSVGEFSPAVSGARVPFCILKKINQNSTINQANNAASLVFASGNVAHTASIVNGRIFILPG